MSEFGPQNSEGVDPAETKETQGIALAKEIADLINEGTDEAEGLAIAKTQELETLFAPVSEPQSEAELYTATELMLEDGSKALVEAKGFSFVRDGKMTRVYPSSVFKLSGVRVRFKGIVDSSDPRAENHGKPIIETDIDSGGGLHRIVEEGEIIEHGEDFWSLEKITPEEIEKQLTQWQEVYDNLEPGAVSLPTEAELLAYLSDNPEFIELLKTKEQQGFVRMVIAPLELKKMIDGLDAKIQAQGGTERYLSSIWTEMLGDEDKIRYNGEIKNNQPEGGHSLKEMISEPESFGILNGCLISFVKERRNLLQAGEADETDSTGRAEIKGGKTAQEYAESYFSGKDPHYQGEQSMLPQEWLALFASDIYEKYLKDNKRMDSSVTDLLDTETYTWFTSTYIPGREPLPYALWHSDVRNMYFLDRRPDGRVDNLAPRPSVRKSLKP